MQGLRSGPGAALADVTNAAPAGGRRRARGATLLDYFQAKRQRTAIGGKASRDHPTDGQWAVARADRKAAPLAAAPAPGEDEPTRRPLCFELAADAAPAPGAAAASLAELECSEAEHARAVTLPGQVRALGAARVPIRADRRRARGTAAPAVRVLPAALLLAAAASAAAL